MDERQEELDRRAYEEWRDALIGDPKFQADARALLERARHGEFPPDARTLEDRLREHQRRRHAD